MVVSSDDLAADVACGLYAARHAVNTEHLKVLWTNLGHFVAECLRTGKVSLCGAPPLPRIMRLFFDFTFGHLLPSADGTKRPQITHGCFLMEPLEQETSCMNLILFRALILTACLNCRASFSPRLAVFLWIRALHDLAQDLPLMAR
jgi:hypothetical protein